MKRLLILGHSLLITLFLYAQRGRVRPEDLGFGSDDSDTSSIDGVINILLTLIIIAIAFGVAKIMGNMERNKQKKRFRAKCDILAYHSVQDYVDDVYSSVRTRYIDKPLIKEGDECYIQKKAENDLCYAYFDKQGLLVVPQKDLERI